MAIASGPATSLPYTAQLVPRSHVTATAVLIGTNARFGGQGFVEAAGADRLTAPFTLDQYGRGVFGPLALAQQGGGSALGAFYLARDRSESAFWVDARRLAIAAPTHPPSFEHLHLPALPALAGTVSATVGGAGRPSAFALVGRVRAHDLRFGTVRITDASADLGGSPSDVRAGAVQATGPWGRFSGVGGFGPQGLALTGRYSGSLEALEAFTGPVGGQGPLDLPVAILASTAGTVVQTTGGATAGASVHAIPIERVAGTLVAGQSGLRILAATAGIAGGRLVAAGNSARGIGLSAAGVQARRLAGAGIPLDDGTIALVGTAKRRSGTARVRRGRRPRGRALPEHPDRGERRRRASPGADVTVATCRRQRVSYLGFDRRPHRQRRQPRPPLRPERARSRRGRRGHRRRSGDRGRGALSHRRQRGGRPRRQGRRASSRSSTVNCASPSQPSTGCSSPTPRRAWSRRRRRSHCSAATPPSGRPTRPSMVRSTAAGNSRFRSMPARPICRTSTTSSIPATCSAAKDTCRSRCCAARGNLTTTGNIGMQGLRVAHAYFGSAATRWSSAGERIQRERRFRRTRRLRCRPRARSPSRDAGRLVRVIGRSSFDLRVHATKFDVGAWTAALGYDLPVAGLVDADGTVRGRYPALALTGNASLARGHGRHAADRQADGCRIVDVPARDDHRRRRPDDVCYRARLRLVRIPSARPALVPGTRVEPEHRHADRRDDRQPDRAARRVRRRRPRRRDAGAADADRRLRPRERGDRRRRNPAGARRGLADAVATSRCATRRSASRPGRCTSPGSIPLRLSPFELGPPTAPISLSLDAKGIDVANFAPFLPKGSDVKGTVDGGVGVGGTVAAPRLSGELALAGGEFASPGIFNAPLQSIGARVVVRRYDRARRVVPRRRGRRIDRRDRHRVGSRPRQPREGRDVLDRPHVRPRAARPCGLWQRSGRRARDARPSATRARGRRRRALAAGRRHPVFRALQPAAGTRRRRPERHVRPGDDAVRPAERRLRPFALGRAQRARPQFRHRHRRDRRRQGQRDARRTAARRHVLVERRHDHLLQSRVSYHRRHGHLRTAVGPRTDPRRARDGARHQPRPERLAQPDGHRRHHADRPRSGDEHDDRPRLRSAVRSPADPRAAAQHPGDRRQQPLRHARPDPDRHERERQPRASGKRPSASSTPSSPATCSRRSKRTSAARSACRR